MTIYHTHHIVPRHAGGTDDPSNLIKLTIEEHAEAHRVLYEQYGRWQDLYAWKTLDGQWQAGEGYQATLSENARDTHKKCKENRTGIYSKEHQSKAGKRGAAKIGLGKRASGNLIRVSCLGCKKETTKPTFCAHHIRKCG